MIAKEEGIKGYWKGNLPQVLDLSDSVYYFQIKSRLYVGNISELLLTENLSNWFRS